MSNKLKAAKAAFPLTIPVLCGYFLPAWRLVC